MVDLDIFGGVCQLIFLAMNEWLDFYRGGLGLGMDAVVEALGGTHFGEFGLDWVE